MKVFGHVNKPMLIRFGIPKTRPLLPPTFASRTTLSLSFFTMPRKAATATGESVEPALAPRRSSRIKDQPKEVVAPKKVPAKPRAKKADKEAADKEDKPKAPKSNKRKAADEPNGDGVEAEAPAAKKVLFEE